jgi:hypothetical protein
LDRGNRRPGDWPRWLTSGTSTSASVHGSDRVDRVKTANVRVEQGSGGLGGQPVEDGGDTCRVSEDTYGVHYSRAVLWFGPQTIGGRFRGFGPQNTGGGSEKEQTACGGIEEFASR